MKIAVIAWGSLVWDPRCLDVEPGWRKDGPELSVDFARISNGERLTLVLHRDAPPSRVLWTCHRSACLETAVENLRAREGTRREWIRCWVAERKHGAPDLNDAPDVCRTIDHWARSHRLDAALWTGLEANFQEHRHVPPTADAAVAYLRSLEGCALRCAEEYVRRAPEPIRTPIRARIESELGWTPEEP